MAERRSHVVGNFFEQVPENAEVYILCGVLHDWTHELAALIIRNCRKAVFGTRFSTISTRPF
jgi:hypothetical protein